MKKVEQVDNDGNIFFDYDKSLSRKELYETILNSFPNIREEDGMICGDFKGKRYSIRAKNITYLGHPHPLYKKRIQIASDLKDFYKESIERKCTPILLGVYTCENNTLFCDFNIEDFIEKKAHNSSAHVYTSDLSIATIEGYFYKEDNLGNKITVFNAETVITVLEEKLHLGTTVGCSEYNIGELSPAPMVAEEFPGYNYSFELDRIQNTVLNFFSSTQKKWNGLDCYRKMIEADYNNKYQPEWPGFYLEFIFEQYLKINNLTGIIKYSQNKKKGEIDLDLFFPKIEMYGDLKAHSSHSSGIQGNDQGTVFKLIETPYRENHIFYIVCEHETERDSDHGFEVTRFWNTAQGKDDLMSYSRRMKNSVELTHAYIFDINRNNKQFLSIFRQGLNSNGKPREPKIMIEHGNFSHFVLTESSL